MTTPLSILMIEDDPADFERVESLLRSSLPVARCERVVTRHDLTTALEGGGWNVVVSDVNVPGVRYSHVLERIRARGLDVPIVLLSGTVGDEQAVELLKQGFTDFVLKGNLPRLVPVIERGLRECAERQARRDAEAALRASEAQLLNALQMNRAGPWEYDVGSDTFLFSDAFYAIFHTTAEREGGYEMSSAEYALRFCHPDDVDLVAQEIQHAIEAADSTRSRQLEHRIRYVDGGFGCMTVQYMTCNDEHGRAVRTFGVNQDVTARRRAEEALAASERRYRTLFEGAAEGIMVADAETRALRYVNRAICRMLGYDRDELVMLGLEDLCPAPELTRVLEMFEAGTQPERAARQQIPMLHKDGTELTVDACTAQLEIDSRPCLVGFFTDISDRVRLEAERDALEAQVRQAQKLEAVGRLAGGVAHDFNNLLQAMMGELQQLELEKDSDQALVESHGKLMAAVRRGAQLTRQLLLVARREQPSFEVLDFNRVLAEEEGLLRRLLREDIRFEVDAAPTPLPVRADQGQLAQVIMNLAVNAADAMPDGGRLRVEAGVVDDEHMRFAVTDSGHGIPDEIRDRIFEPFFTTKGSGEGTGIGLAVARGIVLAHGGTIAAVGAPGGGTTFEVVLPLAPAEARDVDRPVPEPPAQDAPGRGEWVLLVEDHDGVREAFLTLLESLSYNVMAADSCTAAEELDDRFDFDLLLTDIVLPDGRGEQLAARLRARHKGLAVVLTSGYPGDGGPPEGPEALHFLPKPVDRHQLAATLRRALDLNSATGAATSPGSSASRDE